MTTTLYARYLKGDCERVWSDMLQMGPSIREPRVVEDAWRVCLETMGRVNRNILRIISELELRNYAFGQHISRHRKTLYEGYSHRYSEPSSDASQCLSAIESIAGPVPMSLAAWWTVIGSVDLRGTFAGDDKGRREDALMVWDISETLSALRSDQELMDNGESDASEFHLSLCPDHWLKESVSGAGCFTVTADDPSIDGPLHGTKYDLLFVDYLRLTCQWAGFPGHQFFSSRIAAELQEIGNGLIPF